MRRGCAIAVAALVLPGCELVFDLEGGSSTDGNPGDGGLGDDAAPDANPCGTFDEDGDGLADLCDTCPTAPPLGVDDDGDGLDDGCDPRLVGTDRIVAFFGFNGPLAADGWSVVYGNPAEARTENGSLLVGATGQLVIERQGTLPTAYTIEASAGFASPSGKLAVFHDVMVGSTDVGDGRWCYLISTGAPMSVLGWELFAAGEPYADGYSNVPTPVLLARFTLGAVRATNGEVGCVYNGAEVFPTTPMFVAHRGPALFFQVGSFAIDWLVVYEHL